MITNNNKRRSPLGCLLACVTLAKLIPVVFVLAVLAWSYYAYVVELCFFNVEEWPKKLVYLIVYHVLFVLLSWSYLGAVITKNKRPPAEFYLTDLEVYQLETSQTESESRQVLERKMRELPILTRTNTGLARYCDKCKCIKPDRAHHCSACSTCVLKMDHHCPWVNNCVGHSNYKFFVLFLGYAVVYCLFVAATSVEYFIKFWSDMQTFKPGKFNLLFMFFVAIMFGVSILTLFAYHLYLLGKNTTTLETFRAPVFSSTGLPDKYGFNLSRLENYKQVFGPSLVKAFLPISTSLINGYNFTELTRVSADGSMFAKKSESRSTSNQLTSSQTPWSHTNSILTHLDSLCSNMTSFPRNPHYYYRPQLQRTHCVDDSFLISSCSSADESGGGAIESRATMARFKPIHDPTGLDLQIDQERYASTILALSRVNTSNKVNVIKSNKHSSITFASIFKNTSTVTLGNQNNTILEKVDNQTTSWATQSEQIDKSNLDGVIFPTSTKQTLAMSHHQSASNIQGASDALLLKDKQPTTTMATSPSITLNDQNTAFSINLD